MYIHLSYIKNRLIKFFKGSFYLAVQKHLAASPATLSGLFEY